MTPPNGDGRAGDFPPPAVAADRDDARVGRETMRRVSLRLLPFLFVLYIFNYVDRTNVGIAALQMNRDLHFSASAYGLGAGIFFLGYSLFGVPSSLMLARVGARRWIACIMIAWGLIASAMMLVRTPGQFYVLRIALGIAEAGFFPGIVYYLSQWFPALQRARAMSRFMIAIPLAAGFGNPLGGWLLGFDGRLGLAGWQWLFLLEGLPPVVLGLGVLALLTDTVEEARWLSGEQRDWLATRLRRDHDDSPAPDSLAPVRALAHPIVWLLSLPYILLVTSLYGYTFWAPTVIRDALHASNAATGLITGAIAWLAAAAMLVIGASSDRTEQHCFHAAACGLLTALGYVGAALVPTALGRVAALALVGIFGTGFLAPFWCLPTMFLRGSAAAAGIAFVNSIGNVGGFVGPYVIGRLKDATGSTTVSFLALGGIALVAVGLLLVVGRQGVFTPRGQRTATGPTLEPARAAGAKA
jgi:ACS family tartrate transporter-like MFS transporter